MHTRKIPSPFSCCFLALALTAACESGSDPQDTGGGGSGAGSDTGAADATGGSGAGEQGGGGSGSGGAPTFEGLTRVDGGSDEAQPGSADVAVAPDGSIYVSWVDTADDVHVARSIDGGATFGPAVTVDDAATIPLVSMARHPYVAASNDRVVVVFNDENGVYFFDSDPEPLAFGAPTMIGTDVASDFYDFPKPLFLSDGTTAVVFHGYPASGARIFVARETNGFAAEAASSGAPGVPCECCPNDLVQSADGDLLVAFRNNDDNVREMWVARAPGGDAFASWAQVSTSEGTVDACPMQGPRVAQQGSTLFSTWSVRGGQNIGRVGLATSADGGASWSSGLLANLVGDEPTIGVGGSGTIYVTTVGNDVSAFVSSVDGGATWSEATPLEAPDGALQVPQLEGAAGVAALAAVSSAGTVWLRRME